MENFQRTPLHFASDGHNVEIIKLILDAGGDVNAKDNEHNSVLHYVRDVEVAKILIERGADVNAEGANK